MAVPASVERITRVSESTGAIAPPRLLIGHPIAPPAILDELGDALVIPETLTSLAALDLPAGIFGVLLLTPNLLESAPIADWAARLKELPKLVVIAVGESPAFDAKELAPFLVSALAWPAERATLRRTLRGAIGLARERWRFERLERELAWTGRELAELNAIGIALSAERDPKKLLHLILTKARELSNADAGSLYLVEGAKDSSSDRPALMRFVLAQNDSVTVPFAATTIPMTRQTVAGHVGLTGETLAIDDVYLIPPTSLYSFNPDFDRRIGYRTKSMLVVPMKDYRDRVIAILQLINRKKRREDRLTPDNVERAVMPFGDRDISLTRSLASQAAVALENNQLIESIQRLFEGFVEASVKAIEQRDPTTSGHSGRVAVLTCGLAEVVDRSDEPAYRDVRFSFEQMRELRYASLLHDFGKVGVREAVLVKAKKLYAHELEAIKDRFEYARRAVESRVLHEKVAVALSGNEELIGEGLAGLDRQLEADWKELDRLYDMVLRSNEPTILPDGNFEMLQELARRAVPTTTGEDRALLTPDEVRVLSIRKGSLDERERLEIESHVTQTFVFLSKIPWTQELSRVPEIAYAHHEKLNGRGYPRRLTESEIPLPSRMMTVADIYDALTASDRPYKKAIPAERALDILGQEVQAGLLDSNLVRLFVEAKVWERSLVRPG